MDFTKTEVNAVQECVKELVEKEMRDLSDLQLALVGGGIGDVDELVRGDPGDAEVPVEFARPHVRVMGEVTAAGREPERQKSRPDSNPTGCSHQSSFGRR